MASWPQGVWRSYCTDNECMWWSWRLWLIVVLVGNGWSTNCVSTHLQYQNYKHPLTFYKQLSRYARCCAPLPLTTTRTGTYIQGWVHWRRHFCLKLSGRSPRGVWRSYRMDNECMWWSWCLWLIVVIGKGWSMNSLRKKSSGRIKGTFFRDKVSAHLEHQSYKHWLTLFKQLAGCATYCALVEYDEQRHFCIEPSDQLAARRMERSYCMDNECMWWSWCLWLIAVVVVENGWSMDWLRKHSIGWIRSVVNYKKENATHLRKNVRKPSKNRV